MYYSDGIESGIERVGHDMVEEIRPRVDMVGGVPANYTISATNMDDNSPLFVNGMQQLTATPTTLKLDYNIYIGKNKGT